MATVGGQNQQPQRFGPELAQAAFGGVQQPQPVTPQTSVGGGLPGSGGGYPSMGGQSSAVHIAQSGARAAETIAGSINEKSREKRQLEQQKAVIDYSAKTQARVAAAADNFTRWMNQRETLAAKNEVAFDENVHAWMSDIEYRSNMGLPIDMDYELTRYKDFEKLLLPDPASQIQEFDRLANEYGVDQPDEFGFSDQVSKKRAGLVENQNSYEMARSQMDGGPETNMSGGPPTLESTQPSQPGSPAINRFARFYEGMPQHELRAALKYESLGNAVMTKLQGAESMHERKSTHNLLKKTFLNNAMALEDLPKKVDPFLQQTAGVDSLTAETAGKDAAALGGSKADQIVTQWFKDLGKSETIGQVKALMAQPYSAERERKIQEISKGISRDAFRRIYAGLDPNDSPGANGERFYNAFQTRSRDLHHMDAYVAGKIAKVFGDHISTRTESALLDQESWLFSNEGEKNAMRRIALNVVNDLRKGYVGGETKMKEQVSMQAKLKHLIDFGDNLPPDMWNEAKDLVHEYGRFFESTLSLPPGFDTATGVIDITPIVHQLDPVVKPFSSKYQQYSNPYNGNFDTLAFEDWYYRQFNTLPSMGVPPSVEAADYPSTLGEAVTQPQDMFQAPPTGDQVRGATVPPKPIGPQSSWPVPVDQNYPMPDNGQQ